MSEVSEAARRAGNKRLSDALWKLHSVMHEAVLPRRREEDPFLDALQDVDAPFWGDEDRGRLLDLVGFRLEREFLPPAVRDTLPGVLWRACVVGSDEIKLQAGALAERLMPDQEREVIEATRSTTISHVQWELMATMQGGLTEFFQELGAPARAVAGRVIPGVADDTRGDLIEVGRPEVVPVFERVKGQTRFEASIDVALRAGADAAKLETFLIIHPPLPELRGKKLAGVRVGGRFVPKGPQGQKHFTHRAVFDVPSGLPALPRGRTRIQLEPGTYTLWVGRLKRKKQKG
jgi:hypothetical protein